MTRVWWMVVVLAVFSLAAFGGCSGPDGPKRSSLVTESK